ncbi:MAG: CoA-binding protein [Thermomicrobiales bacterium]
MSAKNATASDELIKQLLESAKTIAIVGWSDKEDRPSHETATYLRKQGYRVIPVNPRLAGKIFDGETVYACVTDVPEKIDLVDVFRRPEFTPYHAAKPVEAGAGALWLQLGIINDEAAALAHEGGLAFVQNRCTHLEHLRLIKGYPFPAPEE